MGAINRDLLLKTIKDFFVLNMYSSSTLVNGLATNLTINISDIDPILLPHFVRVQFLINPTIRRFIESLPRIRQQLAKETKCIEKVSIGTINGSIDWGKTMTMRSTIGDLTTPVYSTKIRNRSFDVPYNQLLLYLAKAIRSIILEVEKINEPEHEPLDVMSFKELITNALYEINKTLSMPQLKNVTQLVAIDAKTLLRVGGDKNNLYIDLSEIYEYYCSMILEYDVQTIERSVAEALLERTDDDHLMEMAVLIKIYNNLDSILPSHLSRKYGLFSSKATYVISWESIEGALTLSLYNLPPFVKNSTYKELLDQLNISLSTRIPDISLFWQGKNGEKWVYFFEVKNTTASSSYFRESLYKVIAYTKDFENFFRKESKSPNVILVVSSGLEGIAEGSGIYVTQFEDDMSFENITKSIVDELPF